MHSGVQSSFFRITAVSIAVPFIMQMGLALASPATAGGTDFDIPISELNKVKKKSPTKRETGKSGKKKKADARKQETPSKAAEADETAGQATVSPTESIRDAKSEPVLQNTSDADKSSLNPEDIQTHHSPYSFVVAGKPTVIHAVINSKGEIQEVNCTLATEGGAHSRVKMEKVNGTRFTYTATLPAVPPETHSLRYTIDAVDSLGRESRSKEFVSPVTSSPIVPSWQLESAEKGIAVKQEDAKKPL